MNSPDVQRSSFGICWPWALLRQPAVRPAKPLYVSRTETGQHGSSSHVEPEDADRSDTEHGSRYNRDGGSTGQLADGS